MNWSDFVIEANDILEREFKVKEANGRVQIYEYDAEEQQDRIIFQTKAMLRHKLKYLFPLWSDSNMMFDSRNISDSEKKLFVFLLKELPEYKRIGNTENSIKTYYWLDRDMWEMIPLKDRKKLLKLVKALDSETLCRYMMKESIDSAYKDFDFLRIKILHPEYYRLSENITHMKDIFSETDKILTDDEKKKHIISFEKELNTLLRKYEQKTDGFIYPYPRLRSEIDEMTEKNDPHPCKTEEDAYIDYNKQIWEGLKNK